MIIEIIWLLLTTIFSVALGILYIQDLIITDIHMAFFERDEMAKYRYHYGMNPNTHFVHRL